MLQVALAPAAIAFQMLDHGRRRLLVAAVEIVGQMHFVAGATHERGFDEIVTHRPATDRAAAGQLGKRAMLHERRDPNDRVVAPEVALFLLPEIGARGEDRTVERHRELLQPAPDRPPVDRLRHGLENADADDCAPSA